MTTALQQSEAFSSMHRQRVLRRQPCVHDYVILAFIALILSLSFFSSSANAATYYVATNGLDTNPGSSGSPFRTIQKDKYRKGTTVRVQ